MRASLGQGAGLAGLVLEANCGDARHLPVSKKAAVKGRRAVDLGALGGTRTPNLLIRSQMLYPLSYERWMPR